MEKSRFTDVILQGTKYEDEYWQDEIVHSYTRSHDRSGLWHLRSKVDNDHGGGTSGHTAVQQSVDAGILPFLDVGLSFV